MFGIIKSPEGLRLHLPADSASAKPMVSRLGMSKSQSKWNSSTYTFKVWSQKWLLCTSLRLRTIPQTFSNNSCQNQRLTSISASMHEVSISTPQLINTRLRCQDTHVKEAASK
eukprot:1528912-Amphidinium_carterae.2